MKRPLLTLCLVFVMGGLAGWVLSRRAHSPDASSPSAAAAVMTAPAAAPGAPVALNSAPQKDASGAYPILVSSLLAGDVTEFKPADVRSWGDVTEEVVNGVPQWRVELVYRVKTKFGPFDVTASAYVQGGKVVRWIYTGSGEVIP